MAWTLSRRAIAAWTAVLTVMLWLPLVALQAPSAFAADDPVSVSFTLEGCRNPSGPLPNAGGKFICPDGDYTPGNLGKTWNELDLVPFRLTTTAGGSAPLTQTYTMVIALDREDASRPGYDVISVPDPPTGGCTLDAVSPSGGAGGILSPGTGGIDKTIYRTLTITQPQNTTCVFNYYGRLALGSHLFPGSSLHANKLNQAFGTAGMGAADVSIPVREIEPQTISKDMTATQGQSHGWTVSKTSLPANVNFANTCTTSTEPRSQAVQVTVTWTKLAAAPNGDIAILTHVYATNPAHRTILVTAKDQIRSGTTNIGAQVTGSQVSVAAGATNVLVLTHNTTVPAGTTNLNDIATATYVDQVTGIAVPGQTQAEASANVTVGSVTNATATISDVESITGSGLTYSVDSVSLAGGSFGSYVLGTATSGNVTWTSPTLSASGSATFNKSVYVAANTATSGQLSDVATLTGSSGLTASANAHTDITASATQPVVRVRKTVDIAPTGTAASFTFSVHNNQTGANTSVTVSVPVGQTASAWTPVTVAPSNTGYSVTETAHDSRYSGAAASTPVGALGLCETADASVSNSRLTDRITVNKTIIGGTGTFTFTLDCDDNAYDDVLTVSGTGSQQVLSDPIPTGVSCTIQETGQADWLESNLDPVSVDPGDTVAFTNTLMRRVTIDKTIIGGSGTFTFNLDCDNNTYDQMLTVSGTGSQSVQSGLIPVTVSCTVTEVDQANWLESPTGAQDADPGSTVSFTNRLLQVVTVDKTIIGGSATFTFNLVCSDAAYNETLTVTGTGEQSVSSGQIPADVTCTVQETDQAEWLESNLSAVSANPGSTVSFSNVLMRPVVIDKTIIGGEGTFTFTLDCSDNTYDQVLTVSGTGSQSVSSGLIPVNVTCTVTETDQADWLESSLAAVSANPGSTVSFTNTKVVRGLAIEKDADPTPNEQGGAPVLRGTTITYTLTYENLGNVPESSVVVTDAVPVHTTYVDGSGACSTDCTVTLTDGTLSFALAEPLAVGGTGSVTFSVTVDGDAPEGDIPNFGRIASTEVPAVDSNTVTHTVWVPEGDLLIRKTVDRTTALVGDTITYGLIVNATGDLDQTNVKVVDVVPDYSTYVAGSATCALPCTADYNEVTRTITWAIGDLPAGDEVSLGFKVTVNPTTVARTIINSAVVSSDQEPGVQSNEVRTVVTVVLGTKTVKPLPTTGAPLGNALAIGLALVAAGAALLARSRPRETE